MVAALTRSRWARIIRRGVQAGFPLAWPTPRRCAATWRVARAVAAAIRRRRREDGLTVAVDICPLFETLTGVGWYLHALLQQLADRPGLRLRLYGPAVFRRPDAPQPVVPLPAGRAVEWVRCELPDGLLLRPRWLALLLRACEPWLVAADRNRVLFAPNFILPWPLRGARRPLVVTVHDLAVWQAAWTLQDETRAALERDLPPAITRAAAVLTPSQTVRRELLAAGGDARIPAAASIHVTPEASRLHEAPTAAQPAGVPERFVLHVGTIEPRKNVATLLAAWPVLRSMQPDAPPLVLCGRLGWRSDAIEDDLQRAAQDGWLLRVGYAPDPVVRGLYAGASAVVCASIYEGFGLPLVEAMAAGTPVVCSDIPVFREVAGDAAAFVPPGDAAAWARTLARVVSDPGYAADLQARGAARSRAFTWRQTADQTLAVLADVAGPA